MEFIKFCQALGIVIDYTPPIGLWKRYPTTDHPHKKNGAVKFMGDFGVAQNHATDAEVSVWRSDAPRQQNTVLRSINLARETMFDDQRQAAAKAARILKDCSNAKHPYLKAKGFDDEYGNVCSINDKLFLCIPMRIQGTLAGLQMIDEDGGKKFLKGQRTGDAAFTFDNKGPHFLCEGYATGLSIRAAMKALKRRYNLHICFSAGNMVKVASKLPGGFVIADNDKNKIGELAAQKIGWPYWMSDVEGEDANDTHQRLGLFRFSQELARLK